MSRRRTLRHVTLATAFALPLVAAPLAVAGITSDVADAACRHTHNVVARTDGWSSIRPPAGLAQLQGATADPLAHSRIYAFNATSVVRSDDGGCTWRKVFDAPATVQSLPRNLAHSHITRVAVGGGVWVVTTTAAGDVGTSTVWHSPTGTGNFGYAGTGLPVGATVLQLQPTIQPGTAYALVRGVAGNRLYAAATGLGGLVTWQQRNVTGIGEPIAVSSDPTLPAIVDVAAANSYARSGDGGATFTDRHRVPGRVATIDAAGSNLDVYLRSGRLLMVAGGHFRAIRAPAGVLSATHAAIAPGVRAVSTSYADYGYDPTKQRWQKISPLGVVAQQLQLVAPALPPVLYGVAAGFIYELPLAFPAAFVTEPPTPHRPGRAVSLHGVAGFGDVRPTFAPAPHTVTLRPGQRAVRHYVLQVPARSGPLDVAFLVDTTDSMDPAIAGLRRGMQRIIESLARITPDLQVGLADFRDFADGEDVAAEFPCDRFLTRLLRGDHHLYVLDRRIGPVDAALGKALGRLSSCGGGDTPEADTIAVTQAVTGSGIPGWVAPGQDIGFRPEATKVIVLVTDNPMHTRGRYPSIRATADLLRAYDVKLVGISVNAGYNDAAGDLRALAAGSRTLAPSGGLACGGDGRADVRAGAPMVCSVPITGAGIAALATPVSRLIEQVVVPGLLTVRLHGGRHELASISGSARQPANLHERSELPVTVVFSCPASAADSRTPFTLDGAVGRSVVAHTSVVLRCLPNPPPFVAPPAVAAPGVAAAQPPPPPLTSNVNPNVNPGTGAATQEEQQSQLALADLSERASIEAAVDDAGPDMGAPMLYAAAILMTGAAAAFAFRVRSQPVPQLARVRRKGNT